MQKAFTLIELLVVVLIIGILSAIALPQYRITVARARYLQAVVLCDKIYQAQQVYKLANGTWATRFDELDISLPAGGTENQAGNSVVYPKFTIYNTIGDNNLCQVYGSGLPGYSHYYAGRIDCRAAIGNALQNQICKSIGTYLWMDVDDLNNMYVYEAYHH